MVIAFARRYAPFLMCLALVVGALVAAPSRPAQVVNTFGVDAGRGDVTGGSGSATGSTGGGGDDVAAVGGDGSRSQRAPGSGPSSGSSSSGGRTPGSVGAGVGTGPGGPAAVVAGGDCRRHEVVPTGVPCAPGWDGTPNAGPTWQGVTADAVRVVYYKPAQNSQVAALQEAAGTAESAEEAERNADRLEQWFNERFQFYGRRLEVIFDQGQQQVVSEEAARNEAVRLVQTYEPFAVAASVLVPAMADELTRRQVINWGTFQSSSEFYAASSPFSWSVQMEADLLNQVTAELAAKQLIGRPAAFAGDPALRALPRKFGVLYEDPGFAAQGQQLIRMLAEQGADVVSATFSNDISSAVVSSTNLIVSMREQGVTTLTLVGNVVAPLFATEAAERQGYRPEWLVNGYTFTDTEEAARLYVQSQWDHAFGLTTLALRKSFEDSFGAKAYAQVDSDTMPSPGVVVMFSNLLPIALAVEGSGLVVDPARFEAALFAIPPYGGEDPVQNRVGYGPQSVGPYTAVDDIAFIWWSSTRRAERDDTLGSYERVDGGRRHSVGKLPTAAIGWFR